MPWSVCKTCTSPILREVDEALDKGERLNDIAARTGISKSALSRHNRKCRAKRRIEAYKNAQSHEGRLFVRYEGAPEIHRDDWRPQDVLLIVSYEKKPSPPMLTKPQAQELKQQIENRPLAAVDVVSLPPEILPPESNVAIDDITPDEISFTRAAEPEIPMQQKPESPADAMRGLLATVANSLRGRRCG